MDEPLHSPTDALKHIETMIAKARHSFSENGHLYLVWGWVVFICSLTHFLAAYNNWFTYPWAVWGLTSLAFVYQVYYLERLKKTTKARSYTGGVISSIWLVFFMLLLGIYFVVFFNRSYALLNPLILILYSMPTILSGTVLKVKVLRIGGFICFSLGIGSVFIDVQFHLLLIAIAILVAWIIPGYVLKFRYKKSL